MIESRALSVSLRLIVLLEFVLHGLTARKKRPTVGGLAVNK